VLSGGKAGDHFKGLPIAIRASDSLRLSGVHPDSSTLYLGRHRDVDNLACQLDLNVIRSNQLLA